MIFSSKIAIITILMAIVISPVFGSPIAPKNNSDPLHAYTECTKVGDLEAKVITRRANAGPNYREIATNKATEKVSVTDGYRVMYGYKDVLYYYTNVKIEQSAKVDPMSRTVFPRI